MNRSVTTELDLEAGNYLVMIKITATRYKMKTKVEEVVKKTCQTRPEKLMAVGLSYDLAHARGHLKDSALERKSRLQRERRDKRKLKAKKVFEAQRMMSKKEKLRRLRCEAKEKAKRGADPTGDQDTDAGIEISIKMGDSTLKSTKSQGAEDAVGGNTVLSHERSTTQLKITVESSDKAESPKAGDQAPSGDAEKPAEEKDKQAPEGSTDENEGKGKTDDTDAKGVSTTESGLESEKAGSVSATAVTPATSAESSAVMEGSGNAEGGQPIVKSDENATIGGNLTGTEAITATEGNADQSNVVEANTQLQTLTLDTISDDGLSWNSDIDAPSDSSSDHSSDSDTEEPAATPPPPSDQSAADDDDPANDPWNAVCVFGLRIYSKGSQAEIEVVRKEDGEDTVESKKLDVDDQAADATKKLQKGSAREEEQLKSVGTAPAWDEESKQG